MNYGSQWSHGYKPVWGLEGGAWQRIWWAQRAAPGALCNGRRGGSMLNWVSWGLCLQISIGWLLLGGWLAPLGLAAPLWVTMEELREGWLDGCHGASVLCRQGWCPDVCPELWGQAAPASQASVPLCLPVLPLPTWDPRAGWQ